MSEEHFRIETQALMKRLRALFNLHEKVKTISDPELERLYGSMSKPIWITWKFVGKGRCDLGSLSAW